MKCPTLDSYYEVDLSLRSTGKLLSSDINNTATVYLPQYNLSDEGSLTLSVSDYLTVDRVSYSSDFAQTVWTQQLAAPEITFSSSSWYNVPDFGNNGMNEANVPEFESR